MSLKRIGLPLAMVALFALVLTACGADDPTPTATSAPPTATPTAAAAKATPTSAPTALELLIEEAKAEGGIIRAFGGIWDSPPSRQSMTESMEDMFGMKFDYQYTPLAGGVSQNTQATNIKQELEAGKTPQTDVYRGTQANIPGMISAGAVQKVDWQQYLPRINLIATGGITGEGVLAISTRIGGVEYNTELVPPSEVPTTLAELLDPKWKGLMATTAYAATWDRASIREDGSWDQAKAEHLLDVLTQLVDGGNITGIIGCGDDERIVNGEFGMLVFQCGDSSALEFAAKGAPIAFSYIPEVANVTHSYQALVTGASYPASAKLHMIWMQTEVGQKIHRQFKYNDSSAYEGNTMYNVVADIASRGAPVPLVDLKTYNPVKKDVSAIKTLMKKVIRGG
jgi:ABC-type Fe3+ transport system substrate-binding protein